MIYRRHVRLRWPDEQVPTDAPEWLLYELDEQADSIIRNVELFADGNVTRNSIEIEERNGLPCPSLTDVSLSEAFQGLELENISREEFELAWAKGKDTPFWNVR